VSRVVLAGSEAKATSFTQQQIDSGLVMYAYSNSATVAVTSGDDSWSWLSWDNTLSHNQQQWPSLQDQFQLTVSTAGAQPLSHKSVRHKTKTNNIQLCFVKNIIQENRLLT